MIESVTLVGSEYNFVGSRSYTDSLADCFKRKGIKVNHHNYWKKEFWIGGRNVGGVATQFLSRFRHPAPTDVTHAIFSSFTSSACNVVTVMDLVWQNPGYAEAKILNTIYRRKIRDSVVICPTNVVAEQAAKWLKIDRDKIFTTHLAPNEAFYRMNEAPKFRKTTVLMVGDANERKQTLESIKALQGMDVDVVHIGRPWTTTAYGMACLQEAHKRGVEVQDLGPLSVDALRYAYNRADLLLYPSKDEGFGLPPLEAAACGLQSVVGSHPVFAEVMRQDCVPTRTEGVEGIRQAVVEALSTPLSSRYLQFRASRFSWNRCADATLKAYEAAV